MLEQEKRALEAAGAKKPLEGVLDNLKVWPVGFTLQACFMGGSEPLQQFFVETSKVWADAGNVKFNFGSAPNYRGCRPLQNSHIRIAFERKGNWSYVGVDSNSPAVQQQASLNIGEAADRDFQTIRKERLRGVILHELGHALGLQHEHQGPQSHCEEEFDWPAIYGARRLTELLVKR